MNSTHRRWFLKSALAGGVAMALSPLWRGKSHAQEINRNDGTKIKLSLNAYSFNRPLRDGDLDLFDLVDYCAKHQFDALDATGYYFPGYPEVPADEYIFKLKRYAFVNGLTINGTGVHNDFAVLDSETRADDVQLVKNWISVDSKLGAGVIRIFAGRAIPEGHTFDDTLEWMVPAIQECVETGKQHGVIVALQNHNDVIKTAAETIKIVEAVNSEWFGVMLDVGSLRQGDPYDEIDKLLPYAVSWLLKEHVWYGDRQERIDLAKLKEIITTGGYRGFLPVETLGEGDPCVKVERFLKQVRQYFG